MSLTTEERSRYTLIIDDVLATADLTTISAKQIRKGLQARVTEDVLLKKDDVQSLILERFDLADSAPRTVPASAPPTRTDQAIVSSPPKSNGHAHQPTSEPSEPTHQRKKARSDGNSKSNGHGPEPSGASDEDAKLAAKLQALEDRAVARPTRGGDKRKTTTVRKMKGAKSRSGSSKTKSNKRVAASDDSEVENASASGAEKKERKGGFHKQFYLSESLAALVGENQLSRPQAVKKIWEHIKANELQDPNDKRQIICDAKMHAVFRTDRVHMFTMNKLLGKHIFPVEEE